MTIGRGKRRMQQPAPMQVVYRQEKKFVCGMCRQDYTSRAEAMACISDCVEQVAKLSPVRVVRNQNSTEYQCVICKRGYAENSRAERCAHDCLKMQKQRRQLESQVLGTAVVLPSHRREFKRAKLTHLKLQPKTKFNLKRNSTGDEKVANANTQEEKATVNKSATEKKKTA